MPSDKILDAAEMEHGPMNEWDKAWHKDDMFVPFQPGEARDLGLEDDEYSYEEYIPGLDDDDDEGYGNYDRDFGPSDESEESLFRRRL